MNQRIRELYSQAGLTMNNPLAYEQWYLDALEKFAELIVLESVNAVMDGTKEGDHYAMRIENHFDSDTGGVLHFGVEE